MTHQAERVLDDARDVEASVHDPDRFTGVFDRYFAEIHGYPVAEELRYTSLPPGQSWPAPGGLFSYELFGAGYWTNANPPVR
jgi:hypothetical protein